MTKKILVVGASGATGKLLVNQLLEKQELVRVVVRSKTNLPQFWETHPNLEIIQASLLDMSEQEISDLVKDCKAIASCLGHNLTWNGIYGHPRRLVTDAVKNLCEAVQSSSPDHPVKFVLMNTTGNRNRDLDEKISLGQKLVIGLLRLLLPPHVDNEKAADYLRTWIGQDNKLIEWSCIRPDNLIDEEMVTQYAVHPSPTRSAIFNAGKTSRINVGNFMARLITEENLWKDWKGKMPVIYNKES